MPSANPLRCPKCNEGLMKEAFYSWKRALAPIMLLSVAAVPVAAIFLGFTIYLAPVGLSAAIVVGMGLYLKSKPDWYECPKCGHKKGALWM